MTLKIACEQLNFVVGDIEGNAEKILRAANNAAATHFADLVVFPELAITGYPPEDLLYRPALYDRVQKALEKIKKELNKNIAIIVGYPSFENGARFNKASVIYQGQLIADYAKRELPNYAVFDEKRYFTPGNKTCVFEFKNHKIGLLICEDIWQENPVRETAAAGADIFISINASPFAQDKENARHHLVKKHVHEIKKPFLYCALVGGQDEIVFDGGSFFYDAEANLHQQARYFVEQELIVAFDDRNHIISHKDKPPRLGMEEKIYKALVLAVRDYVHKNNFAGVLIGLSGGVDSALTCAIAVDALAADKVHAVMMPSQFTAQMSLEDAKAEASALGVDYSIIDIEPAFSAFKTSLKSYLTKKENDVTEQNLQARCRGVLLMALSNNKNYLVLTTGNKSEMAVGYATLYGDMAGGFAALKDVYKTMVYRLCDYRNAISPLIPLRVLTRAPSAELAPDQKDQDNLPPYDILDQIIERYVGHDESPTMIIEAGFDKSTVEKVVRLIKLNEYKRRQAPIGARITERAFGKDRRYPITSRF